MTMLTGAQVQELDPYAFLAVLGERVIHPGSRASTDRLLGLDAAARRCQRRGREPTDQVRVEDADIRSLPYPDDTFDVVVAEAVTMFVGRR
jgi:ubiquinone/menaquinone biosynthesis C-methylase UbiE